MKPWFLTCDCREGASVERVESRDDDREIDPEFRVRILSVVSFKSVDPRMIDGWINRLPTKYSSQLEWNQPKTHETNPKQLNTSLDYLANLMAASLASAPELQKNAYNMDTVINRLLQKDHNFE